MASHWLGTAVDADLVARARMLRRHESSTTSRTTPGGLRPSSTASRARRSSRARATRSASTAVPSQRLATGNLLFRLPGRSPGAAVGKRCGCSSGTGGLASGGRGIVRVSVRQLLRSCNAPEAWTGRGAGPTLAEPETRAAPCAVETQESEERANRWPSISP